MNVLIKRASGIVTSLSFHGKFVNTRYDLKSATAFHVTFVNTNLLLLIHRCLNSCAVKYYLRTSRQRSRCVNISATCMFIRLYSAYLSARRVTYLTMHASTRDALPAYFIYTLSMSYFMLIPYSTYRKVFIYFALRLVNSNRVINSLNTLRDISDIRLRKQHYG